MDKILLHLTEIEMEIENLEPSTKEVLLDKIDAFRAEVIKLLTPRQDDIDEDDDSADQPEPEEENLDPVAGLDN